MSEEMDDIIWQLGYVVENIDNLDKETTISVLKAAVAEIMTLRIAVAMHARDVPDGRSDDPLS
ncbi:MAG: hypothetical protein ACXWLT_05935 [Rhizomicrobium sp.]